MFLKNHNIYQYFQNKILITALANLLSYDKGKEIENEKYNWQKCGSC